MMREFVTESETKEGTVMMPVNVCGKHGVWFGGGLAGRPEPGWTVVGDLAGSWRLDTEMVVGPPVGKLYCSFFFFL